jgi:DNA-binding CsgD family transcriptional regulator
LHSRALARLASLRLRQGRLEEAEELLGGARQSVAVEAEVTLWTAALALARGDALVATRILQDRLVEMDDHAWHVIAALDLLVDAHLGEGRLDDAADAAERLAGLAAATSSARAAATAAGARGRVALARGDDGAVTLLSAALDAWSSLALPFEAARTRFDLARALAGPRPDAAIEQARRALTWFEQLGASAEADRVAAFLRSLGVVPRTGAKNVGRLTEREQEVLALVALGLSNPEIAARLHVSTKTASHHVSHILTKLGLRNRTEAAACAATLLGERREAAPPG